VLVKVGICEAPIAALDSGGRTPPFADVAIDEVACSVEDIRRHAARLPVVRRLYTRIGTDATRF
jgi:hypothetical protein